MKYRCSKCNEIFEGQPDYCPHCGIKLSWNNKPVSIETDDRESKRLAILRQLNLIKALYSCYKVNSSISNFLGRQVAALSSNISNNKSKTAVQVIRKEEYHVPKLYTPTSNTPWIAKYGAFLTIGLCIILAIIASVSKNNTTAFVTGIIAGSLHLIYVLAIIISGIAHAKDVSFYKKVYNEELKKAKEYNKQIDEDYEKRLKNYDLNKNNEVTKMDESRKILLARREKYLKYELTAKEAYEKVLNTSFVHPKYRDIVPICQFIDYLDTKRCWELIDVNGCYNKYEEELRQNLIISKLDNIESHLQQIESNQQMLARTLKSIDANCRSVYNIACNVEDKLGDLKENMNAIHSCQQIIAKYNAEIASNTEQIINDMAYYYRNK